MISCTPSIETSYGTFRNDFLNDIVKGAIEMPATLSGLFAILINYRAPKSSLIRVATGGAVVGHKAMTEGDRDAKGDHIKRKRCCPYYRTSYDLLKSLPAYECLLLYDY